MEALADVPLEQLTMRLGVVALVRAKRRRARGPVAAPVHVVSIHGTPFRSGAYSSGSGSSARDVRGQLPGDQRAEREAGRAPCRRSSREARRDSPSTGCRSSVAAQHARPHAHDPHVGEARHHPDGHGSVAGSALPDRRVARRPLLGRDGQPPPMMNVPLAACFSVRRRPMCCTSGSSTFRRGSVTLTCSPSAPDRQHEPAQRRQLPRPGAGRVDDPLRPYLAGRRADDEARVDARNLDAGRG